LDDVEATRHAGNAEIEVTVAVPVSSATLRRRICADLLATPVLARVEMEQVP
jgi:hypothetical protein